MTTRYSTNYDKDKTYVAAKDAALYAGKKYGITDDMIGWYSNGDADPGTVTIGGKDAFNLSYIDDNSTGYADLDSIKNAIDTYAKTNSLGDYAQKAAAPVTVPKATTPTNVNNNTVTQTDYSAKIDKLLNQIMSFKTSEYDPEDDPVYQAYAEQYSNAGDRAMTNTMSQASALTGGRANSWAVSAGQQAKANYDQELNAMIPELASAAYTKEQNQFAKMIQQAGMLMDMDTRQYNRSQDAAAAEAEKEAQLYEKYKDMVSNYQWQAGYDLDLAKFEHDSSMDVNDYELDVAKYNTDIEQYNKDFDYNALQDEIANYIKNRQLDISSQNASTSAASLSHRIAQDAISNDLAQQRLQLSQAEFDFKVAQAAKDSGADEGTLGAAYFDMMNSGDPKAWLTENSQYMTDDELKGLENLLPKDTKYIELPNGTKIPM